MIKSTLRFLFVLSFIILYGNKTFANDATYCNQQGNTTVCNTYHNDGTMDQQQIIDNGNGNSVVLDYGTLNK
jgi:hypothetical protein